MFEVNQVNNYKVLGNREVLFTDIIGKLTHYAPSKPLHVTQDTTQLQMIYSMRIYHKNFYFFVLDNFWTYSAV